MRSLAVAGGETGLPEEGLSLWLTEWKREAEDSWTGHHRPAAAGKVDLGYLFLPRAWGHGYAAEACAAALDWFDGVLPGEPVVLTTQTANVRSIRLAAKGPGSTRTPEGVPGELSRM